MLHCAVLCAPVSPWLMHVFAACKYSLAGRKSRHDMCSNACGRDALKGYVKSIVLRNNTITGVRYRDDPTIMAWDLINEPFNPGDDTGKVLTVGTLHSFTSSRHLFLTAGI